MKLAIVGSISLADNAEAAAIIEKVLDQYQPALVISGGAPGIDTMAEAAAKARGIPTSIHLPRASAWEFYKARNLKIAMECEHLVRIVSADSSTYGSGWTRDQAKKLGKPTEEYIVG